VPNVVIVGGGFEYSGMFKGEGWNVVHNTAEADMVQFTGGADVTPSYYGHTKHPYTYNDEARDAREAVHFRMAVRLGKPMAGICRGGQFLNVMCGGKMIQHCDMHGVNDGHWARDERTGEMVKVTSTHHQMMVPHKTEAEVIMTARESLHFEKSINNQIIKFQSGGMRDIEALYYKRYRCFCFQPHPEFQGWQELKDYYFDRIAEFFNLQSLERLLKDNIPEHQRDVNGQPLLTPQL